MARTKPNLREGVSLAKRSGCHSEPHTNPEVKILMQQYVHHEVHSRHQGRFIEENEIDNFGKGWNKLRKGKLQKWVDETTRAHVSADIATRISALHTHNITSLSQSNPPLTPTPIELANMAADPGSDLDIDEDSDDSEDGSDTEYFRNSSGTMEVVDGRLIAETLDMERTVEEVMVWLDEEFNREECTQGNDSCTDSDPDSDTEEIVREAWFLRPGKHY